MEQKYKTKTTRDKTENLKEEVALEQKGTAVDTTSTLSEINSLLAEVDEFEEDLDEELDSEEWSSAVEDIFRTAQEEQAEEQGVDFCTC